MPPPAPSAHAGMLPQEHPVHRHRVSAYRSEALRRILNEHAHCFSGFWFLAGEPGSMRPTPPLPGRDPHLTHPASSAGGPPGPLSILYTWDIVRRILATPGTGNGRPVTRELHDAVIAICAPARDNSPVNPSHWSHIVVDSSVIWATTGRATTGRILVRQRPLRLADRI